MQCPLVVEADPSQPCERCAQDFRRQQNGVTKLARRSAVLMSMAADPTRDSAVQGADDDGRAQTVYTVRLRTGFGRDAGIRAPHAGVLVCLVGKDRAATLHRVGPLYDAETTERELQAICKACPPLPQRSFDAARQAHYPVRRTWPKHASLAYVVQAMHVAPEAPR